jgi:hypothetical protein
MKNLLIAATLIATPVTANANEVGPKLISVFETMGALAGQMEECNASTLEYKQWVRQWTYKHFSESGIADTLYNIFKDQKIQESARLIECDPDLIDRTTKRVDQQLKDLEEMAKE